ncbi:hypothetical protein HIM_04799 [Hirsutella minnesotensis 3608]|uniref:PH-response regulator protein palI/RIM9 n=1 Tax=Hirsutella minnesotensis 3608 TaxID=1043627 RepID=A0A0F7ZPR8_9HYPO|nr:hypothetical protein HIM_04799 [Hirsutella minnesotensis 3608]
MLRPATPLTVLLLIAFGLLLMSVLSAPIIKAIPMGSFKDVTFGVFGFCKEGQSCSPMRIGYDTAQLLDNDNQAFDLPAGVRDTVSVALIVHPVAVALALVIFIMAAAAHFHGPGHSAGYLLTLFIFIIITFLVGIVAFLVDVLLFIPHMAFGSYMVLAGTIILGLSAIGSCAMRRSLVSRLAHKKRIEQNAEMSGENYYAVKEDPSKPSTAVTSQPTLPTATSANADTLPQFASFEDDVKVERFSEDAIPLTRRISDVPPPMTARAPPPRDPYALAANGPPASYGSPMGRGGMGTGAGFRGRGGGGYGRGGMAQGRAGYGLSGTGSPRGGGPGYVSPPRGGYGNRGGRGPPPVYNNMPGQFDNRPVGDTAYYGQQTPGKGPGPGPQANPNAPVVGYQQDYEAYNPSKELPRAESPPPFPTPRGNEAGRNAADNFDQYGQVRDNDLSAPGIAGLQRPRPKPRHETMMTEGSRYSTDDVYAPPRAAWNQGPGLAPRAASPGPLYQSSAVETPGGASFYGDVYSMYGNPARPESPPPLPSNPAYQDIGGPPARARSPSESERSHFTSISQRGVNPQWNPNQMGQGPPPRRLAQQQKQRRQDILLDNPDFQLPGSRAKGVQRGAGMITGGAYPTGL